VLDSKGSRQAKNELIELAKALVCRTSPKWVQSDPRTRAVLQRPRTTSRHSLRTRGHASTSPSSPSSTSARAPLRGHEPA